LILRINSQRFPRDMKFIDLDGLYVCVVFSETKDAALRNPS